ncbi:hypothetical protein RP726_05435 [Candidatus Methylospira mobilis]|uniref:hypothetical protein n=1 Tax=Candidatus Methylospira mobilis TaxID=1808979 RepID=UPI0028EA863B|nr:hypothetical protein [Candidatus Methylospira mobilis]WNV05854.1 hypothetical protein RP726_05435 [Candidatus Methylospira mobilis]
MKKENKPAYIDRTKRTRRGPERVKDPRTILVRSRFNKSEVEYIDAQRGPLKRAEWLRCAALNKLTPPAPVIPALNFEAWRSLARTTGNLNQVTKNFNTLLNAHCNLTQEKQIIASTLELIKELRAKLIGSSFFDKSDL